MGCAAAGVEVVRPRLAGRPWGAGQGLDSREGLVLPGLVLEDFAPRRGRPGSPPSPRPRSQEFRWFLDRVRRLIAAHPGLSPEDVWFRWKRARSGDEVRIGLAIQRPGRMPWRFMARVDTSGTRVAARNLRVAAWEFRQRLLRAFPLRPR